MIPALAVAVGLVWFFSKESKKSSSDPDPEPTPSPDPVPEPEPEPSPDPSGDPEFVRMRYRWSPADGSGDETVWTYQKGSEYSDGTTRWGGEFVVIGNATHTEFLTQNSSRGAINIRWEATGRTDQRDSKNVVVFASVDDAIAYLEKEDEDDPTRPELPPSNPPPDPDRGLPPIVPDFGGGQTSLGDMTPSFGGGY